MKAVTLTSLTTVGLLTGPAPSSAQRPPDVNAAAVRSPLTLKQDMRKLWTDHVVWTLEDVGRAVGRNHQAIPAKGSVTLDNADSLT